MTNSRETEFRGKNGYYRSRVAEYLIAPDHSLRGTPNDALSLQNEWNVQFGKVATVIVKKVLRNKMKATLAKSKILHKLADTKQWRILLNLAVSYNLKHNIMRALKKVLDDILISFGQKLLVIDFTVSDKLLFNTW